MQEKLSVKEVNYYTDYVLVTNKQCMDHNEECTIFHHRFLKSSDIASHARNSKNDPPFIYLI